MLRKGLLGLSRLGIGRFDLGLFLIGVVGTGGDCVLAADRPRRGVLGTSGEPGSPSSVSKHMRSTSSATGSKLDVNRVFCLVDARGNTMLSCLPTPNLSIAFRSLAAIFVLPFTRRLGGVEGLAMASSPSSSSSSESLNVLLAERGLALSFSGLPGGVSSAAAEAVLLSGFRFAGSLRSGIWVL